MNWYENAYLSVITSLPTFSDSAGLSTRYMNNSSKATSVHILDGEQFAGTVDLNCQHLRVQKIKSGGSITN